MVKKHLFGLSALCFMVLTTACQVDVERGLNAVSIGSKIYGAFKEARDKEPDYFMKRVPFYAGLYCDFRIKYALKWVDIRTAALDKGVPDWAVEAVKKAVDKKCSVADEQSY